MTSRDHLGDVDNDSSEDDQDDQTWWGPGASEDSEPPAIVLNKPREVAHQRNSLGFQRGLFYRTSQQDTPLVANMATADNRHSMVPEIPERATNAKRYRLV